MRKVKWGECDPAGIVYTPRYADYVAEAHLAFFEHVFSAPPYEVFESLQLTLPAKAIVIEYKRSLRPNECFEMQISVGEIRTRTFDLDMTALNGDGAEVFVAKFTLICVDRALNKAVSLPQFARDALMQFHGAQAGAAITVSGSTVP